MQKLGLPELLKLNNEDDLCFSLDTYECSNNTYGSLKELQAGMVNNYAHNIPVIAYLKVYENHLSFISGYDVIRSIQTNAMDCYGEEALTYLDDISDAKAQELKNLVNSFLEANAQTPRLFKRGQRITSFLVGSGFTTHNFDS